MMLSSSPRSSTGIQPSRERESKLRVYDGWIVKDQLNDEELKNQQTHLPVQRRF